MERQWKLSVLISYLIFYIYFFVIAASCQPCSTCLHIPLCTVMLTLIFNSTAYCHAHSFILYILYFVLYIFFYSFYFMYTSLVLYSTIFALSMEQTRLTFHCWLYNLCIVVYVTNKTWNLKLETWKRELILLSKQAGAVNSGFVGFRFRMLLRSSWDLSWAALSDQRKTV